MNEKLTFVMATLALLDVVAPYVFRGENLGPSHAALSALRVVRFESAGVSSLDDPAATTALFDDLQHFKTDF